MNLSATDVDQLASTLQHRISQDKLSSPYFPGRNGACPVSEDLARELASQTRSRVAPETRQAVSLQTIPSPILLGVK